MKSISTGLIVATSLIVALSACDGMQSEPKTTAKVSEDASLIPVSVENYNKAEAARNFRNWAKLGGDNKLLHLPLSRYSKKYLTVPD